jgi:hypothetical protein
VSRRDGFHAARKEWRNFRVALLLHLEGIMTVAVSTPDEVRRVWSLFERGINCVLLKLLNTFNPN